MLFIVLIIIIGYHLLDNVQQLMTAQELLKSEIASIQNLIKEQLSVFKSTLTSHNQIISDVRVLLKSLAKVSSNLLLINVNIKNCYYK